MPPEQFQFSRVGPGQGHFLSCAGDPSVPSEWRAVDVPIFIPAYDAIFRKRLYSTNPAFAIKGEECYWIDRLKADISHKNVKGFYKLERAG